MANRRHIALIRHGETEGESSIRYHGTNDVPLADSGRRQVAGLVPLLAPSGPRPGDRGAAGPDVVWPEVDWSRATVLHSPLSRALESAQILADGLGIDADRRLVVEGFREIHFGRFEGMTAAEIRSADPEWYAAWRQGETDAWPGGDSVAAFGARVEAAWERALLDHPGDLLVVAHRGVVRFGLRRLLAMPPDAGDRFHVALGSVSIVADVHRAQPAAPPANPPATLLVYDRTAEDPSP